MNNEQGYVVAGVLMILALVAGMGGGYFMGYAQGQADLRTTQEAEALALDEREVTDEEIAERVNPFSAEATNPLEGGYQNPFEETAVNPFR